MSALYRSACALASRGHPTFPCQPRQKLPATPHGVKDATCDLGTIEQWWKANPAYNVGLATGKPGGFWVLDIDGDEGEATIRRLEAEHGALPTTVEVITGNGGRHLYFRLVKKQLRNTVGKLGPGVDSRANGGYVLVPPSWHPCGVPYRWSVDTAAELAEPPDWLVKAIAEPAEGKGKPLEDWHKTLTQPIPNGCRNSTLTSIAGKLLFHDLNLVLVRDLLQSVNIARCDPPLPADEVDAVIVSVARTHLSRDAQ